MALASYSAAVVVDANVAAQVAVALRETNFGRSVNSVYALVP